MTFNFNIFILVYLYILSSSYPFDGNSQLRLNERHDPIYIWTNVTYGCRKLITSLNCEIHFLNNEIKTLTNISLQFIDVLRPISTQNYLANVLCTHDSDICNILSLQSLQQILAIALDRAGYSTESFTALNRYNFYAIYQQVVEQKITFADNFKYLQEYFSLKQPLYQKRLHVSVVIDGKSCTAKVCRYRDHTSIVVENLKNLQDTLIEASAVLSFDLVLAMSVSSSELLFFNVQCDYIKRMFSFVPKVSCAKVLVNDESFEKEFDFRGTLNWVQFGDHIFFVNPYRQEFTTSYSMFNGMNLLLFSGFWQNFSIVSYVGTDELYLFGVHRSFFEIFQSFSFPFCPFVNNLIFLEAFASFHSSALHFHDQVVPNTSTSSLVENINDFEDFVDEFQSVKRRMVHYLLVHKDNYFPTVADISFDGNNAFYMDFCISSLGCLEDDGNFMDLFKEKIESSELLFTSRLMDIVDIRGYRKDLRFFEKSNFKRHYPTTSANYPLKSKVAVITAIYGGYESSCKPFMRQTISTDFYCFSDNEQIENNGWILDSVPYHLFELLTEFEQNHLDLINSYHQNQHPFNIAKFFKLQFFKIPILSEYTTIIWIDGTIRITNENATQFILKLLSNPLKNVIVFEHSRAGNLSKELEYSILSKKYLVSQWKNVSQPVQRIVEQFDTYIRLGYNSLHWKNVKLLNDWMERIDFGVFCTCFLAFNLNACENNEDFCGGRIIEMLNLWYEQNLIFSTQDQLSFPFVLQRLNLTPIPLPQSQIYGNYDLNSLFVKLPHGE